MHSLILASQSPRRREILEQAGFAFHTDSVKVSEIIDENLNLDDALMALAQTKAEAYGPPPNLLKEENILILSADTVVVLDQRILGKPKNLQEASDFLHMLSGKTHGVKTALCLWEYHSNKKVTAVDTTLVEFRELTSQEIADYVATGEPMDKAGAYGIQGQGRNLVKSFTGSWTNVVGLPLELFERLLKENGWNIHRRSVGASTI